eukprot:g70907.t1
MVQGGKTYSTHPTAAHMQSITLELNMMLDVEQRMQRPAVRRMGNTLSLVIKHGVPSSCARQEYAWSDKLLR